MDDRAARALQEANHAIQRDDVKTAFRIWKGLASEGVPLGQHCLGWCYAQGVGIHVDYSEAFRLFNLAALRGIPESMVGVGDCYETGRGVEQDIVSAYCWYRAAELLGDAEAARKVTELKPKLAPAQLKEADVIVGVPSG
jgi:TPR repeat protein